MPQFDHSRRWLWVMAISNLRLLETPIAVLDFETTGLSPGYDRPVEISIIRIEPGAKPRLVFDTLINPDRRVGASWVHGITDSDVRYAPTFEQIVDALLFSISGCVIAAHNATFDMNFLHAELRRLDLDHSFLLSAPVMFAPCWVDRHQA